MREIVEYDNLRGGKGRILDDMNIGTKPLTEDTVELCCRFEVNYFENRATNASTESLNLKIKKFRA